MFMKKFSNLLITRAIGYLLVLISLVNCKKEYHSPDSRLPSESISKSNDGGLVTAALAQSQTRIAHLFNNFNGFDDPYQNNWAQNEPELVATDDNVYAFSNVLAKSKDLSLSLKDFRFEIPSDATITKIIVTVRRFKTGKGSITDYFATLNIVSPQSPGLNNPYGVRWTDLTKYPAIETAFNYSQNGTGSNGGPDGKQTYQWTPLMINNPAFGVRIDTYGPVGGSVKVYYDYVQITVEYS
jgi:hypothetical protein